MVEGGKIDWACHANDAATVFNEVKDMDNAIKVAYEFYKKHPKETLIVVTADHETGAVSYTHLDVYKRQGHNIACLFHKRFVDNAPCQRCGGEESPTVALAET